MNTRSLIKFSIKATSLLSSGLSFFSSANAETETLLPKLTHLADPSDIRYAVYQHHGNNGYANDYNVKKAIEHMQSEYNLTYPFYIPSSYDTCIKSWPADSFGYDFVSLLRNGAVDNTELEAGLISLLDAAQTALDESRKRDGLYFGIGSAVLFGLAGLVVGICVLSCHLQRRNKDRVELKEAGEMDMEASIEQNTEDKVSFHPSH